MQRRLEPYPLNFELPNQHFLVNLPFPSSIDDKARALLARASEKPSLAFLLRSGSAPKVSKLKSFMLINASISR